MGVMMSLLLLVWIIIFVVGYVQGESVLKLILIMAIVGLAYMAVCFTGWAVKRKWISIEGLTTVLLLISWAYIFYLWFTIEDTSAATLPFVFILTVIVYLVVRFVLWIWKFSSHKNKKVIENVPEEVQEKQGSTKTIDLLLKVGAILFVITWVVTFLAGYFIPGELLYEFRKSTGPVISIIKYILFFGLLGLVIYKKTISRRIR